MEIVIDLLKIYFYATVSLTIFIIFAYAILYYLGGGE